MSVIAKIGKKYENLLTVIDQYDECLADAEEKVKITGKTLSTALKEQASYEVYYNQRLAEIKTLLEYFENEVQKQKSKAMRILKESYSRDISDRMAEKYVLNNQECDRIFNLYLEIKEIYDKYVNLKEAFISRGYILGHITKAKVAEVHQDIL